jgi:hypothetical protein
VPAQTIPSEGNGAPAGKKTATSDLRVGQCVTQDHSSNAWYVESCGSSHEGKVTAVRLADPTQCPATRVGYAAGSGNYFCIDPFS